MNRVQAKIHMLVIMIVMIMNWMTLAQRGGGREDVEIDGEMSVEEVDENEINESIVSGEDD